MENVVLAMNSSANGRTKPGESLRKASKLSSVVIVIYLKLGLKKFGGGRRSYRRPQFLKPIQL